MLWRNAHTQELILLNEFIRRPLEVLASTLDVLGKDIPPAKKIDAIVSRAVHGMSRPFPSMCSPSERSSSAVSGNSDRKKAHDSPDFPRPE